MIFYVETNFVLELAFAQEEYNECRAILELAKERPSLELALPTFSIGEAFERKRRRRTKLQDALSEEIGQLQRSEGYAARSEELRELTSLLVRSTEEQKLRLDAVLDDILDTARVLPLEQATFAKSVSFQRTRGLSPQDSLVYASVIADLERGPTAQSCFVTRNPKDFSDADIEADLARYRCKPLFTFAAGLGYARSRS